MTEIEQKNLVKFGEEIGILVTPILDCGVIGVDIMDLRTFDSGRAHYELLSQAVMCPSHAA